MNRHLHLGAPDLGTLFANGRSPACWQRQVSRAAERRTALAQSCAWVDKLSQQPGPKLRPGPLLGGCLAELVSTAPPPSVESGETGQPSGSHAPARAADTARPRTRKGALAPPRPSHEAAPPLFQPLRARPDLLQRWAEKTAVSHSPRRPAATRRPQPPQNGHRAPLPPHGRTRPAWSEQIIRRTRQQFAAEKTAVAAPQHRELAGHSKGRLLARMPLTDHLPAHLSGQWQQPLTGQMAPSRLLNWPDTRPAPAVEAPTKPDRPSGAALAPNGQPDAAPPLLSAAPGAIPTAPVVRPSSGSGERPFASTPHSAGAASAPPHPDDADDGWFEAPRFAPPQLAEVLPRLRPLPKPGTPSISPLAAATAERSARREAESAPEDLDALARKLKQILDEESRRHGINV